MRILILHFNSSGIGGTGLALKALRSSSLRSFGSKAFSFAPSPALSLQIVGSEIRLVLYVTSQGCPVLDLTLVGSIFSGITPKTVAFSRRVSCV